MQAFRDALERSRSALESNVTVPRERIQEVVDDAVKRGRMTRSDANELVSNLVSRSRKATDDLLRDLEKLLDQARKEVERQTTKARKDLDQARKEVDRRTTKARKELGARGASTRRQAKRAGGRAARAARDAADRPLAEADKLRRRAGAPGPPITGYEQLTASQVKTRLKDMSKGDLRKVRTQEKRGKARKGILDAIDKQLAA